MNRFLKNRRPLPLLLALTLLVGAVPAQSWPEGRISRVVLNNKDQIKQGLIHWSGPQDASLEMNFRVQSEQLILDGQWIDDDPHLQLWPQRTEPKPGNLKEMGDSIRVARIAPVDGAPAIVTDFLINLGPFGTNPRITLLDPEASAQTETLDYRAQTEQRFNRTTFRFSIPLKHLFRQPADLERGFWVVRLNDLDGDGRDETVLEDRSVVVRQAGSTVESPTQPTQNSERSPINHSAHENQ